MSAETSESALPSLRKPWPMTSCDEPYMGEESILRPPAAKGGAHHLGAGILRDGVVAYIKRDPRAEADRRDGLSAGRETTSALCGENHLNGSMSGMPARWMVLLIHLRGASPGDIAYLLIQLALLDIG